MKQPVRHSRALKVFSFIAMAFAFCNQNSIAQSNVAINYTGDTANPAAILDVKATNKGVLLPRVALSAANSNSPIGSGITTSLLVYNTATAGTAPNNVIPGYYYWNGTKWISLAQPATAAVSLVSGSTGESNTVGNTTNETNLTNNGFTYTIPANTLSVGDRYRVTLWGRVYTPSTSQVTSIVRFKVGSTILNGRAAGINSPYATTGIKFEVMMKVVSIGTSGTVITGLEVISNPSTLSNNPFISSSGGAKPFNTTINNTLQFSWQWIWATAGNAFTAEDITFEKIPAP